MTHGTMSQKQHFNTHLYHQVPPVPPVPRPVQADIVTVAAGFRSV